MLRLLLGFQRSARVPNTNGVVPCSPRVGPRQRAYPGVTRSEIPHQPQRGPTIVCPTNMTAPCTGTDGAQVFFSATVTDNCDPNPTLQCTPASGSWFGIGTNLVTCRAADSSGNTTECTFTITVTESIAALLQIVRQGTNVVISWPRQCAEYAIEEADSLQPERWAAPAGAIDPNPNGYSITLPIRGASLFYRLKKQ